VRAHESELLALAMRVSGNPSDARDLVQDTLESALSHFPSVEENGRGWAWLATVLRHRAIDLFRKRRQGEPMDELLEQTVAAPDPYEEPSWAAVTREQHEEAVRQLSEELRTVYQLKALDGMSYYEVSQRLGIATATVGTRLMRARRMLRTLLAEELRLAQGA
jgi:RNA polymerase sigma-70 factor, ECF subfamily